MVLRVTLVELRRTLLVFGAVLLIVILDEFDQALHTVPSDTLTENVQFSPFVVLPGSTEV